VRTINLRQVTGLMDEIAACKAKRTCGNLGVTELYFEPNPKTLDAWRSDGFYREGIDTRLMFLAERPSDRRGGRSDFEVNGQSGWRCWNTTVQDRRFAEMRGKYGFENCLISNVIKCGLKGGKASVPLSARAAKSCSGFLIKEVELVRPAVIACLGRRAFDIFLAYTLPYLSYTPLPVYLTHYSARFDPANAWAEEMTVIKTALEKRGLAPDAPSFAKIIS